MIKKSILIVLALFSISAEGQILNDVEGNLTWKDSIDCKRIFQEIDHFDYSFVTSELFFIEAKNNTYKEIKTTYFIIGVNTLKRKAYKIRLEKYDVDNFKKYNQSDTTERKYAIRGKKISFDKALNFFRYINDIGFHKLNKDSLTTTHAITPNGQHVAVSVTHSMSQKVYVKSHRKILFVESYLPHYFISKKYKPYIDREKFVMCVDRYKNLFWSHD